MKKQHTTSTTGCKTLAQKRFYYDSNADNTTNDALQVMLAHIVWCWWHNQRCFTSDISSYCLKNPKTADRWDNYSAHSSPASFKNVYYVNVGVWRLQQRFFDWQVLTL